MAFQFPVEPGLLVSLDALLRTQNVTVAARELGVTQSAMSQRLRRMREALGDPLLVVSGGGMICTERAREMAPLLRRALQDLAAVSQVGAPFEPAHSQRTFQVACTDVGEFFVLPHLMQQLGQTAPGIRLVFRAPRATLFDELEQGTIDIAVGMPETDRAGFRAATIGEEGYVVVCRPAHPILHAGSDLEDYLRCQHLLIAPTGAPGGLVDAVLSGMGRERQVTVQISHFLSGPFIASSSELVLTCPESLARRAATLTPLQILPVPVPLPGFQVRMLWHERSHRDAGHRWLRTIARESTLEAFSALSPLSATSRAPPQDPDGDLWARG